jgi:hypothetical protein
MPYFLVGTPIALLIAGMSARLDFNANLASVRTAVSGFRQGRGEWRRVKRSSKVF